MPGRHKIVPIAEHERFGAYLKSVREGLNVSGRELSRRLDLRHGYVQKIEQGSRQLPVPEFINICKALGLTPSEVLARFESRNRETEG